MSAILLHRQWDKVSVRVFSLETRHIYNRLDVYIKQRGVVIMTTPRHHKFVTMTRCHKRPQSRHTDSPLLQFAIHKSNIYHNKAIHIWHEHVGPGHDLIKDFNSCNDCAAFILMRSIFQTCAPQYWKERRSYVVVLLRGCINLHLSLVSYGISALTKRSDKQFGAIPSKILNTQSLNI